MHGGLHHAWWLVWLMWSAWFVEWITSRYRKNGYYQCYLDKANGEAKLATCNMYKNPRWDKLIQGVFLCIALSSSGAFIHRRICWHMTCVSKLTAWNRTCLLSLDHVAKDKTGSAAVHAAERCFCRSHVAGLCKHVYVILHWTLLYVCMFKQAWTWTDLHRHSLRHLSLNTLKSLAAHLDSACCKLHWAGLELSFLAMCVAVIAMTCSCMIQQSGALDPYDTIAVSKFHQHTGVLSWKLPSATLLSCHQHKHNRQKTRWFGPV